jgi:hypothetical protein
MGRDNTPVEEDRSTGYLMAPTIGGGATVTLRNLVEFVVTSLKPPLKEMLSGKEYEC